jgi:hypothetical protein
VQAHEVAEHGAAQVRADPLAEPGHEVEAQEGADGDCRGDDQDQADGLAERIRVAAAEAASISTCSPLPRVRVAPAVNTSASAAAVRRQR